MCSDGLAVIVCGITSHTVLKTSIVFISPEVYSPPNIVMVDKLFGYWKLEKSENLDAFMKENKVGLILRKVGNTLTSYEEISKDGDQWTLHITSTFKNSKLEFKLGEPFTKTTLDGRTVKATFSIEGSTLVCLHEPISKDDVPSRYEREVLEDGRMMLTCTATKTNVVAKRYFTPCEK